MGSYTGAKIEELCTIKVSDVTEDTIKINDSKASAIPIHHHIRPVIERLKSNSTDGYLMSGLTFDKYMDRSGAMCKRFGKLKTSAGLGQGT